MHHEQNRDPIESKTVGEWLREWPKDGVAAREDEQHEQCGGK
jgi:hypothetical protein